MKYIKRIDWKRLTIYSSCLTALFFIGGCAAIETVGEGMAEVGQAIGLTSPKEGVEAAKDVGRVVSYFYPAVGGGILTVANGIGWLFSKKRERENKAVAESLMKSVQKIKKDLENGGKFESKDELIEVLEDAGATQEKAQSLYYDWKKKYKGKEPQKRGILETIKKILPRFRKDD